MRNFLLGIVELVDDTARDSAVADAADKAFNEFRKIVNIILPVIIATLLVVGIFYGIKLGINYAKADDDDKKKKAKDQLINVLVGILIAIVFVAVVEIILNQGFVKSLFGSVSQSSVAGNA